MYSSNCKTILIVFVAVLLFSCASDRQPQSWKGLGEGDGYLEISDSTLTFNVNDHFETTFVIDKISKDSIICSRYDPDSGKNEYAFQFKHANDFKTISARIRQHDYDFIKYDESDTPKAHDIREIKLSIYNYEGGLDKQIQLSKEGLLKFKTINKEESIREVDTSLFASIFTKTSRLDLDNFKVSEESFIMVPHAPSYCLEISYDFDSSIKYCRQKHNRYLASIVSNIKELIED